MTHDLSKVRRTGFLMILSPEGQVFAEVGATELRVLDLSGSHPVKAARGSRDAVVGSWVLIAAACALAGWSRPGVARNVLEVTNEA